MLAAIAGAFSLGKSRGTSIAETKADQQRTEERAAATEAIAERRVESNKGAGDVQQTVSHMPDDDVDRELRGNWTRKVELIDTSCDWVKPIYLTDNDITVADRQTKRDVLAHNRAAGELPHLLVISISLQNGAVG